MLTSLNIQNVVLIEKLTIEFESGLCVLTGETGTGKSILLDSLGLALGARSESGLVRKGADQAAVTAIFEIHKNHPALKALKDADLEGSTELILRRSVSADGRSKAYINDQPVSIALLRAIGDTLVEIHGQFESQGLLNSATHRQLLDEYAGVDGALPLLWEAWKNLEKELEGLKSGMQKSRAEEEYLRQAVEDLDALDPKPGEEQQLAALRERLMNRERVLEGLNAAYHILTGENDPVSQAWSAIDRIADKLDEEAREIIASLDSAASETGRAAAAIQAVSAALEESDHNLETIDDRLFALRGQARKHGCAVDELTGIRQDLAQKLNMIEHGGEMLSAKTKETEKARKTYAGEAERISGQRKKSAGKLDALVNRELPPLRLDKARFMTDIQMLAESDWGPGGMDRVRFLVSTNPGAAPGPLDKIASGGEMARFMLALKVVMAETGSARTLVFDEVDSGIGGAAAAAAGERLAQLAQNNKNGARQVLVVTHSPQVAARAAHHYIVLKNTAKDVKTSVVALKAAKDRREEIARMLAGATITEEARAAADKLLETGT